MHGHGTQVSGFHSTIVYHHMLMAIFTCCKRIDQPAIFYETNTVPMASFHIKKMEGTEMKQTLRDHVVNYNIRERLKEENITERCRKTRLRWF